MLKIQVDLNKEIETSSTKVFWSIGVWQHSHQVQSDDLKTWYHLPYSITARIVRDTTTRTFLPAKMIATYEFIQLFEYMQLCIYEYMQLCIELVGNSRGWIVHYKKWQKNQNSQCCKKETNQNQCKGRSEARHSNRDLPPREGAQLALGFNLSSICWIDFNHVGLIPRMWQGDKLTTCDTRVSRVLL